MVLEHPGVLRDTSLVIVYVGAGSGPFRDLVIAAGHGQMVSRQAGAFRIPKRGRWAFDNGAFGDWKNGIAFNNEEYLRRIRQIVAAPLDRQPDWCVVPDIVGQSSSLAYSLDWKALLKDYAPTMKWYLALQDNFHPDDVDHALCLEKYDGLFIGGTTEWKLATSPFWVQFGHERGLPVHIARVNGPARLQWSVTIGADSVDGTGWVYAGEKWLPYLQDVPEKEVLLFEHSTEFPVSLMPFKAWLEQVYSETSWKERLEKEEDQYDWVDSIGALSPREFTEWFNRAYGTKLTAPEFSSDREYKEWATDLLAYAEHYSGVRPAPPLPEAPIFVLDKRTLVPLSKALGPHRSIDRCKTTGREELVVKDSRGSVMSTAPIIRAWDIQEAKKRAEDLYGKPVIIPSHEKTRKGG